MKLKYLMQENKIKTCLFIIYNRISKEKGEVSQYLHYFLLGQDAVCALAYKRFVHINIFNSIRVDLYGIVILHTMTGAPKVYKYFTYFPMKKA